VCSRRAELDRRGLLYHASRRCFLPFTNGLQQKIPLPIFGATELNSTFETTPLFCHATSQTSVSESFEFGEAVARRLD